MKLTKLVKTIKRKLHLKNFNEPITTDIENPNSFYFKLYKDNELVRDIIAVKNKTTGEECYFDKVSGELLRDTSTIDDATSLGKYIDIGYQEVEYIPRDNILSGTLPININNPWLKPQVYFYKPTETNFCQEEKDKAKSILDVKEN